MQNIEIIKDLSKPISQNDINWKPDRVSSWGGEHYCFILPYKNARVDMKRLDEVCGGLWQNSYKRDSQGVLQCEISIYDHDIKEWVSRCSNGVPSSFEKQKGEYSDAFKRAGVMWGIGRELYNAPDIKVPLNAKEFKETEKGVKLTGFFKPQTWRWSYEGHFEKLKASQKIAQKWVDRVNLEPYKK